MRIFELGKKWKKASPGLAPGTLVADPNAAKTEIQVMAYGPDHLVDKTIQNPKEIGQYLDTYPVLWVNVVGLGDLKAIEQIGKLFNVHRMALEDVLNTHQRTKIEDFGNMLFVVLWAMFKKDQLEGDQVSLFLGKGFVLTFRERRIGWLDPVRQRIRESIGQIRTAGPDYLAYCILDAVVDNYFPTVESYGDRLETIHQEILDDPTAQTIIPRLNEIRRDLRVIRHAVWPLREIVNSLLRDRAALIGEDMAVYLRDCYDHTIQVIELIEVCREQGSDLANMYMSSISNNMNSVMKVLAIIATLFIPLTFIAGIYGMNFNAEKSPWNMPELNWVWGYPFALGLMLLSAIAMIIYFKRKKWM